MIRTELVDSAYIYSIRKAWTWCSQLQKLSFESSAPSSPRPEGVTAIAWLFLVSGGYLGAVGFVLLLYPGFLSLEAIVRLGRPWLGGLELGGRFVFLIGGWLCLFIGLELLTLKHWARWAATLVCLWGVFLLIPIVSTAANDFRLNLLWSGMGIIVRVIVVWYLWQESVREAFDRRSRT